MTGRAVLLGRVSRGERNQDPENQLIPLRAAAQRHGLEVAREVSLKLSAWDRDSAAEVRRRVLEPIIAGEADVLMVWALDRVTRGGAVEALRFVASLEEHYGARFWSLQEPFLSTTSLDPAMREFMLQTMAWFAKWESERRSQRLRAKVEAKRNRAAALDERGRWGRGRLASNDEIAKARFLREAGNTIRGIASLLGLPKSQVGRMLRGQRPKPSGGIRAGLPGRGVPSSDGGLGQPEDGP